MNDSPAAAARELGACLRAELKLKLFLTILLNLCFYFPYALLQRQHLFAASEISPTFLDHLIPFSDKAVWLYFSIFLLMPIGPLLMRRREQLVRYAAGILLIETAAYFVFLLWPTWCPRPNMANAIPAYRALISFDTPGNAFPSLHAAFAVFSALCAARVFRGLGIQVLGRIGVGVWAGLILLGTLMTKQHTVADVLAGSALGFAIFYFVPSARIDPLKVRRPSSKLREPNIRSNSTAI